ncbi:LCP family protein [Nocardioides sp.]|uniref:LCP family protein n=1 Tax=Nocardioides sp. TaxID=35761 RepID=UPI00356681C2
MAERPPRDGAGDRTGSEGPEKGTPEYNWLYGSSSAKTPDDDATRAVPRQPRPDETRVMPTVPREGSRRPAAPTPAASGRPTPPTPPRSTPASGGDARRPRFRMVYVLALVLLWIVYLVAVPLFAWTKVEKVNFEPKGKRPAEQPGTTYLLVGSDSRAGLTPEQRRELGTGNAAGQRTDTIMLLHTGSGPNLLMSIPRDSIVDIPDRGSSKINAAFAYGGPKLLVRTIEQNTGIRVDAYVEIGLGGVVDVVDAVGGIEICPTVDMEDKLANLDIKKGCQQADGKTALGFARSRKTDPQYGDITRAKHQREVVSAVGRKVVSPMSVINPFRYWDLAMAAPESFAFGEGASPVRAALWASAMTRVNGENGLTCGVPIADLAVHWDSERAPKMFRAIINDDTESIPKSLCTPSGLPKSVTG